MQDDACPLTPLGALLRAEHELFGQAETDAAVLSGVLCHEHPMAWRYLPDQDVVEALTLVPPSPAQADALPPWRDPGWAISAQEPIAGDTLTLWWHAATQQAMLASCIARSELRRDTVAQCLRLHHEGVALCRRLAQQAWAQARTQGAFRSTSITHRSSP